MTESVTAPQTAPEAGGDDAGFGVYVHWPFCLAKCPYCDFNSHAADGPVDEARWRAALAAELRHYADQTNGRTVTSLFFGGGTPSLMSPDTINELIQIVQRFWPTAPDLEVTLEANPSTVEAGRFSAFRAAGVTRLSLGVQALNDADLRVLGRVHDAETASKALEIGQDTFEEYSFDLIYGRPEQTVAAWRAELAEALPRVRGHLSVYQLTIEPGTAFHRAGMAPVDPDVGADLYDATQDILGAAGLAAYEISNHARPGHECRHNLTYWRGGDYVGAGPGAHGRLSGPDGMTATHQIHDPARWLALAEARGHGTAKTRRLAARDRATEMIMMGLRLTEGIDRARFRAIAGTDVLDFLEATQVAAALDAGYLTVDERRLAATAEGRLRLNALVAALLR